MSDAADSPRATPPMPTRRAPPIPQLRLGVGECRHRQDRGAGAPLAQRLLLAGVNAEKILCLTYTKTAAAEMQNRLLEELADWATLSDAGACASALRAS